MLFEQQQLPSGPYASALTQTGQSVSYTLWIPPSQRAHMRPRMCWILSHRCLREWSQCTPVQPAETSEQVRVDVAKLKAAFAQRRRLKV